jgi:diacylglycerol kinase family enzyme
MKLLFVVNPISGGVDKEPFLKKAVAFCNKYGHEHHIFRTTGKEDDHKLKETLNGFDADKVISVGGDGTTLMTSLVLKDTNYPVGIIPMGSANGMATELFVDPDPMEALKDIVLSEVYAGLDIIVVNDIYHSIHIGDVGVNAQIVYNYEKDPNRGMLTYAKYFLEQLNKLETFPVTISANGKTINDNTYMMAICNARKFGTGVPLNLDGNPMDGKFEIVLVNRIDVTSLIRAGLTRFDESFFDSQTGKVFSTDYAEIEFDRPRLLQLDGEVIGEFKHLKIEIIKSAVQFITHKGNKYIRND